MRRIRITLAFVAVACVSLVVRAQDDDDEPGQAILETPITFALDRATVRQVVEAIAQETGMRYMAVDDALDMERTVTLHVTDRPVEEALEFLEDHLQLDVDYGRLVETGVLVLGLRQPEEEEQEEGFAPQLDHAHALKIIRSHPTVGGLLKTWPDLVIELEWDEGDRGWHAQIIGVDDEEVGEVGLREYDDGKPRIVFVEIERDLLRKLVPEKRPEKKKEKGLAF